MATHGKAGRLLIALLCLGLGRSAQAVDGVIEINQAAATAGGVTTGDTMGFPVTISAAGSYRLTGNLTVNGGNETAILVTHSDVTIDLNGFTIGCLAGQGQQACGPSSPEATGSGIVTTAVSIKNVTIRNGVVRGMGSDGINVYEGRIENLTVTESGGDGINAQSLNNPGTVVFRSTVRDNNQVGVRCYNYCQVVDSVILNNTLTGIEGQNGLLVTGNTIASNKSGGVLMVNGNITGNRISGNTVNGAYCSGSSCVIADNSVTDNTLNGIVTLGGGLVRGNAVSGNTAHGLNLNASTGYQGNVMTGNNGGSPDVTGGVNLGGNACNGTAVCP